MHQVLIDRHIDVPQGTRISPRGRKEPAVLVNAQQFSVNSGQVGKQGCTEESGLDPVSKGEPLKICRQSGDGHICVLNNSLLIVH